jgi:hypothetical protein
MVSSIANLNICGPGPTKLRNRIVAEMLIGEQAPLRPDSGRPTRDSG